ncbi:14098_t:CDS:2, partial [Gigaspora margarita]
MSDVHDKIVIGYKCVLCRHQGKKCEHDEGMLGIYKCKKCERKKVDCKVQCNECYKKNIPFSEECENCKVVIQVQPIRGNFVGEDGRIYFQTTDGTIKVEIEQEGLEDLLGLLQNIPNIRGYPVSNSVSTVINPIPEQNYPNVANFYGSYSLPSVRLYGFYGENYAFDQDYLNVVNCYDLDPLQRLSSFRLNEPLVLDQSYPNVVNIYGVETLQRLPSVRLYEALNENYVPYLFLYEDYVPCLFLYELL